MEAWGTGFLLRFAGQIQSNRDDAKHSSPFETFCGTLLWPPSKMMRFFFSSFPFLPSFLPLHLVHRLFAYFTFNYVMECYMFGVMVGNLLYFILFILFYFIIFFFFFFFLFGFLSAESPANHYCHFSSKCKLILVARNPSRASRG